MAKMHTLVLKHRGISLRKQFKTATRRRETVQPPRPIGERGGGGGG
jgi:hypothetical protein